MPGLISSTTYTSSKSHYCDQFTSFEALTDAIEWELLHAVDFRKYPLVDGSPMGEVRYYQINVPPPGAIVVFTFEDCPDERKVLLLDCRVPARLPDEDR